ncbi:hypothetical protein [Thermostichus vulcanus]|nr:hypothetical protein [Thermostichus vulcanus]
MLRIPEVNVGLLHQQLLPKPISKGESAPHRWREGDEFRAG